MIAVEAPVILADEPTASLDPRYQIDAMRLLRGAAEGALVIVVSHELGLAARFADTVLVLDHGRLVASGPPHRGALGRDAGARVRGGAIRHEHDGAAVIVPWAPICLLRWISIILQKLCRAPEGRPIGRASPRSIPAPTSSY